MTAVSIVIISKNERSLAETVEALVTAESGLSQEILVVDSSAGGLDDIREEHPGVRWIRYEPAGSGKRVTIPEQRNLGVREAKGEVIVFLDSGCLPTPGWLNALTGPIVAGTESMTVGSFSSRTASVYDGQRFADGYIEEAPTLNMAFTRETYTAVDGFDEAFSYCSDVDFCWRVRKTGRLIRMIPHARVLVDWGGGRRQARRAWSYGAGRARLYRKHLDRLPRLPRQDPILAIYPLFLLGLPLTLLFPLYPLLLVVPLWRSRRAHPVATLVDHLCYGAGALGFLVGAAR